MVRPRRSATAKRSAIVTTGLKWAPDTRVREELEPDVVRGEPLSGDA
jgi:hypothetical protein